VMIRSLLTSQFFRAQLFTKPTNFTRLYNSTTSVYQNSQDYFDVSDELIDFTKSKTPKRKKNVKSADQDVEWKDANYRASRKSLVQKFKHFLNCTDQEALMMTYENKLLMKMTLQKVTEKIEVLFDHNVSTRSILENPWLLTLPDKYIEQKIPLVLKLQPRNINDMIHMIRLSPYQLRKFQKIFDIERPIVPEGNRLYYFATKLNVEPALVSKYFVTHMFMFEIDYKMFDENLDIMIEYKVEPIAILRDLWAFKYLPKSIRARFDRCLSAQKVTLKPWMVRCTEEILERSLTLSKEDNSLLGDSTVLEYLSERLGYDTETMESIIGKHEIVLSSRVKRVSPEKFH
jgi:hypothetical protein